MRIKFWGTRGSIPVPGKQTIRFGGNTPCIEIKDNENEVFIIDAGTGIRELGIEIMSKKNIPLINLFVSHAHWDHIQGLPFFDPLYNEKYKINLYSNSSNGLKMDQIIDTQLHSSFFPVNKDDLKAELNYIRLKPGEISDIGGIQVEALEAHHSPGTLGFKFSKNEKSFVYLTDNEIYYEAENSKPSFEKIEKYNIDVIKFCKNTDYLIHDCMYRYNDFGDRIGWGHSNNLSLAVLSILADIKNLILFHYDPSYSDETVQMLLNETVISLRENNSYINCVAAYEGMEIVI